MTIQITNWDKFQHYKDRKPSWIKLYLSILDNQEWHRLSDFAAKLLVELWCLAAEKNLEGKIDADTDAIAWRLRYDSSRVSEIGAALVELEAQGFIATDSSLLANPVQDRTDPVPRGEESREEQSRGRDPLFAAFTDCHPRCRGVALDAFKASLRKHPGADVAQCIEDFGRKQSGAEIHSPLALFEGYLSRSELERSKTSSGFTKTVPRKVGRRAQDRD